MLIGTRNFCRYRVPDCSIKTWSWSSISQQRNRRMQFNAIYFFLNIAYFLIISVTQSCWNVKLWLWECYVLASCADTACRMYCENCKTIRYATPPVWRRLAIFDFIIHCTCSLYYLHKHLVKMREKRPTPTPIFFSLTVVILSLIQFRRKCNEFICWWQWLTL